MMNHCLFVAAFLLSLGDYTWALESHNVSGAITTVEQQQPYQQPNEENCSILCLIDVIGSLFNEESEAEKSAENEGKQLYLCRLLNYETRSRAGYRIELPPSFTSAYKNDLSSAAATVCISHGEIDRDAYRVKVGEGAKLSLVQNRRKLQSIEPIVGTRSILAIKLSTTFMSNGSTRRYEDPGLSTGEIEGAIFGTGPYAPSHNLVSQYQACSFGALELKPAVGPNIENGVAHVQLRKSIAGGEILGSLQDDILEATEEAVGSLDQYDHIIYCIPDDALMDGATKWTAFTYFHSHWSFFQKRRCSAMSVTIHELGHNLGFRHSGYQSEAYGDESGYMGFTVYQTGAPVKCFNAHKNWVSGWFLRREQSIDPDLEAPVLTRLVTFVDYDKPGMEWYDVVLLRIGPYFMQYNRAKGINVDTGMDADKVSITYAKDHFSDSEAIIGLTAGQKTQLSELPNNIVVEVCEFGSSVGQSGSSSAVSRARQAIFGDDDSKSSFDYAWVSVYVDGKQKSQCSQIGKEETPKPSKPPASASPSFRPTAAPSMRPSALTVTELRPTPFPVQDENFQVTVEYQQERVQKKRLVDSFKDTHKLVREEDEEPHSGVRGRRLKGRDA